MRTSSEGVLDRLGETAVAEAADPEAMLRAVASSGAQVRQAGTLSAEAGLERLAEEGRPRSVVVLGMGGSGVAGDVLSAAVGPSCPVPVLTHRGYDLPAWVGAADLVVAVSCSGTTEETLSGTDVAIRRRCRLLAVGAEGSPLHERARQARGLFVPVPGGRQPRASMWALSTPLVVAAGHLGLLPRDEPGVDAVLEATAARLHSLAERCRPDSDVVVNPAKSLALALQDTLPVIWGSSALAGVAAYRFACQLAENAKLPALAGALPEANHNVVMVFDGPAAPGADDLFRDRLEEPSGPWPLRLVLLRDAPSAEHPRVARRAEASKELVSERGLGLQEIVAEGESGFERLAELVGLTDYASVYLAMLCGVDPTPVGAIEDLKRRIAD